MNFIDITGRRFGSLTALHRDTDGKWVCRCDCGNFTQSRGGHLRSGAAASCGKCNRGTYAKSLNSLRIKARNAANDANRRAKGRGTISAAQVIHMTRLITSCYQCGDELAGDWTLEHKLPLFLGGTNDITNISLSHKQCNTIAGVTAYRDSLTGAPTLDLRQGVQWT